MSNMLIYLLKVGAIQFALVLFYALVLRKDTFYNTNRSYFLLGTIASFVLPMVKFSQNKLMPNVGISTETLQNLLAGTTTTSASEWWEIFSTAEYILIGLLIISAVFMAKIIKSTIHIYSLPYSRKGEINGVRIKYVTKNIHPFSFGRTIYVNNQLHSEQQLDKIIRHESVHIKQRHTIDIVLTMVNRCLFWWNPAAWALSKFVRGNLEYIVDKKLVAEGIDKKDYQYNLLNISQLAYSNSFNNNFSLFNLKNRIKMMNKKETKRIYAAKWMLVLPLAVVMTILLGYDLNAKGTEQEKQFIVNGKVMSHDEMIKIDKKDIKTISVHNAEMEDIKVVGHGSKSENVTETPELSLRGADKLTEFPLVIVDNKEITKAEFDKLDVNTIEAMAVLKDKSATEIYGEKGKNGVIIITLKK